MSDEDKFNNMELKFQRAKSLRQNFSNYMFNNDGKTRIQIRLERSDPHDKKPTYTLTISQFGKVEYEGINNVHIRGKRESNINTGAVKEILRKLEKIYFFSLNDNLVSPNSENNKRLSKISVSVNNDIKEMVFSDDEYSLNLNQVAQYIDEVTNSKQWVLE